MTDPNYPPEQPGVPPPPGGPPPYGSAPGYGPPPGSASPSPPPPYQTPGGSGRPTHAGPSIPGLDLVTRDAGAWAGAAVVAAVLITIFADLIYAVSSTGSAVAASGFAFTSRNVSFRVHLLAFTEWATLGVALALLVGVGLVIVLKPSVPASFRSLVAPAAGALSLAVVLFAFIRAIVWLSYGHDYGVAAFVEALAAIPVGLITAALAFGRTGPSA
jgi:hypothetical protein